MDREGDQDAPLYVPDEFAEEHVEEARRTVAESRGLRGRARRMAQRSWSSPSPVRRLRIVATAVHTLAAVVAILFTVTIGTWGVGLAVVGIIALSLLAVFRLITVLDEAHRRDRPGPPPQGPRPPGRAA